MTAAGLVASSLRDYAPLRAFGTYNLFGLWKAVMARLVLWELCLFFYSPSRASKRRGTMPRLGLGSAGGPKDRPKVRARLASSLARNHLKSYPCPKNINFLWNQGFLIILAMLLQILTGILLGLHYSSEMNYAYYSIMHIVREVYFGWCFRYTHSSGASFIFIFIFLHIGRALYYASYLYISNAWITGIVLFTILMGTAFMGYVLPWGQMSFWGCTVITNLLSPIPCLVPWICGGFFVSYPSLSRFYTFHFILPFIIYIVIFVHIFYLHQVSSNNPLGSHINNPIPFFPFFIVKDLYSFFLVALLSLLEIFYGFISLSHPDNAFEVSVLVTPLHIVPEWYFSIIAEGI